MFERQPKCMVTHVYLIKVKFSLFTIIPLQYWVYDGVFFSFLVISTSISISWLLIWEYTKNYHYPSNPSPQSRSNRKRWREWARKRGGIKQALSKHHRYIFFMIFGPKNWSIEWFLRRSPTEHVQIKIKIAWNPCFD